MATTRKTIFTASCIPDLERGGKARDARMQASTIVRAHVRHDPPNPEGASARRTADATYSTSSSDIAG
jgi:hypothetical protein